jgi:hypothetical protein
MTEIARKPIIGKPVDGKPANDGYRCELCGAWTISARCWHIKGRCRTRSELPHRARFKLPRVNADLE